MEQQQEQIYASRTLSNPNDPIYNSQKWSERKAMKQSKIPAYPKIQ